MKFEKEFAQLLFRNAVIFIDSAIGYINKGLDSYVNMLQAIVNLQFAMELALKSSVVSYCGIRTVLVSKQSNLSDSEIEDLYSANKLKVREFDDIKNFTKEKSIYIILNVKNISIWSCFRSIEIVFYIQLMFLVSRKEEMLKRILCMH